MATEDGKPMRVSAQRVMGCCVSVALFALAIFLLTADRATPSKVGSSLAQHDQVSSGALAPLLTAATGLDPITASSPITTSAAATTPMTIAAMDPITAPPPIIAPPPTTTPAPISTSSSSCNPQCYIERYNDLFQIFKGNLAGALGHYENSGKAEGRTCRCSVCNLQPAEQDQHVGMSLRDMPKNGFGTCCRTTANGDALFKSVVEYISRGGRLIDTAIMYDNHLIVGEAIRESNVPRDRLWVTTKVQGYQVGKISGGMEKAPGAYKGPELLLEMSAETVKTRTLDLIKTSLRNLCLEYLDLVLIHNPTSQVVDDGIWSGLVEARKRGIVKHIGLSNFGHEYFERYRALDSSNPPEVLQTYYFPASPPGLADLVQYCKAHGIRFTAIGSLGGSRHGLGSTEKPVLSSVKELADKYKATPGQILLRWALDQGLDIIPGSSHHIQENLNLDFFFLTPEEISRITEEAKRTQQPWYLQR